MAERNDTTRSPHLPRVPALDGLRGVAVLAVLLFHDNRLTGGYLGVDLFFVLSGFLITTLLLVEHRDRGRVGLARFYERRARRLLPALGVALVLVAIYASVWAQASELPRLRWDGIATLFYFANWRDIAAKQSYWDIFTAPSALQHTWSLSIEEQFYALWPLIVIGVLAIRRSARAVLAVALAIGGACAALTVVDALGHGNQRFLYYGTPSRAPALLMGAALAAAVVEWGHVRSRRARAALEAVALVGVVYLAYTWTHQNGNGLALYRGPLLLSGLAATIVIAAAAHPERGPIARVLAAPPLVGAGLISYGLYLYHWPLYLVLTPARTHTSGWTLLGLRAAVSIAVAIVSYKLVEQPIRHGALKPARAFTALATATALVVAALVVTTRLPAAPASAASKPTAVSRHWPRATATAVPTAETRPKMPAGDWSLLSNTCDTFRALPAVHSVGRTRQPKVLVVGDSVGCFVGTAIDEQQVAYGVVSLNRSRLACPMISPVRERYPGDAPPPPHVNACTTNQRSAIATFRPDVSILMVGGPLINQYDIGNGKFVDACAPSFVSWYEGGVRSAIDELSSTGARVVVVSVVHPPKRIDIGPGVAVPASYDRAVDCMNRGLKNAVASRPRASYLDLDAYICPHGACHDTINGVTLRSDGRHFENGAATLVARWMLPKVLKLAHLSRAL
ncbi:MAG TPA: acyltransferase [Acidimicrobiia bacterium]|nr:acyltransferase [Acidimicrobiia bacterium]